MKIIRVKRCLDCPHIRKNATTVNGWRIDVEWSCSLSRTKYGSYRKIKDATVIAKFCKLEDFNE